MLREFIAWLRRFPDVWFATGGEVAEAWATIAPFTAEAHLRPPTE
jgi:hypothetical protein